MSFRCVHDLHSTYELHTTQSAYHPQFQTRHSWSYSHRIHSLSFNIHPSSSPVLLLSPFIYSSPVGSACYLLTHAPHSIQFISRKRSCLRSSSRHTLHVDVLVPAHQLPVRKYTYVILSLAASVSASLFPLVSSLDSFVARNFLWVLDYVLFCLFSGGCCNLLSDCYNLLSAFECLAYFMQAWNE